MYEPVHRSGKSQKTLRLLKAVNGVSFSVCCGEIFGILGQNGAGKTTIVECLQGLRHADGGHVRVLGLNPSTQAHALRRRIGCQLQESALPDRNKGLGSPQPVCIPCTGQTGLAQADDRMGTGGKGQSELRFSIRRAAPALVRGTGAGKQPEIVFLDEMTTGFDPAARHLAWNLIRKIRARGTSVIMVTHFMDEAEELCDNLVIIDKGLVAAQGSPQALLARYAEDQRVIFTTEATDLSWLNAIAALTE